MMATNNFDLEEEILSYQPYHHHIFEALSEESQQVYPRPREHLEKAAQVKQKRKEYEKTLSHSDQAKLKAITAVQDIAKTKPIGEQPTLTDWDTDDTREQETIAMMRYCGFDTTVTNEVGKFGDPANTRQTVSNHKKNSRVIVSHNGSKAIPLLMDDDFFKLRPRSQRNEEEGLEDDEQDGFDMKREFNKLLLEEEQARMTTQNEGLTNVEACNETYTINNTSSSSSSGSSSTKVSKALRNAMASAREPPKNSKRNSLNSSSTMSSNCTESTILDTSTDSSNSSKSNTSFSYANILKSKESTTKQKNILEPRNASNKYYTPRELYLLKKKGK